MEKVDCIYNGGIVMGVGDMEWCKLTGGYCGGVNCHVSVETIKAVEILRQAHIPTKGE